MRETRNAQHSIFDFYAPHALGSQLKVLSDQLDKRPEILDLIAPTFLDSDLADTGASGLSVESIFRCLLLKQILRVSYVKLAFHLCDSPTYRTFARLTEDQQPSRSGLQSTIRRIDPDTLERVNNLLVREWIEKDGLSIDSLRIDSTVVDSNIAPPRDSQLLDDGVRVLSRMMAKCKDQLGVRIRFSDQRKRSKSLAFRIFHAKLPEKEALYPQLLVCVACVLKQSTRAIEHIKEARGEDAQSVLWIDEFAHYRALLLRVVDQTQRRVFEDELVPAREKIVSLFEPHTDIIVKSLRDVQYGHKVNLATQADGFITYLTIEEGNTADSDMFLPVLDACEDLYGRRPKEVVADGCYASQANVSKARKSGIARVVFNKMVGLTYKDMGVKKKTFKRLSNFRAGIEGNVSEFKRAFGASKAMWKRHDGFKAFVWSSVLSYNLIRMTRFSSG